MSIQEKLKAKIKKDCDLDIAQDAILIRRTLSWSQATAGQLKWYWYSPNKPFIGSTEGMKELLKCKKIEYLYNGFDYELFTS